ncbi:MAG: aldolase [Proteobacteria bacterium]|nr:aldolase [Pseudomonadota bacterium]
MLKYMFITDDADVARHVVHAGVQRIFFDLEILGKKERQGHLDTLISAHDLNDLPAVRAAIGNTELLVRVNPLHENTLYEIDTAIRCGADLLMLPMFKHEEELQKFIQLVDARAKVVALVETPEAFSKIENLVSIPGIDEMYIGLNDLSLALGLNFMFEPLINGTLEYVTEVIKKAGIPFGFGGIARVGEGLLPAECLLGEHMRLGSHAVILSRTFTRKARTLPEIRKIMDVAYEIKRLKEVEIQCKKRTPSEVEADQHKVKEIINTIIST